MLSVPIPARPMTLRFGAGEDLFGDFGGGADRKAVIVADDFGQLVLVLAKVGLEIDVDAAVFEDLNGGFAEAVGDEYFGGHVVVLL